VASSVDLESGRLYDWLKARAAEEWGAYVGHPFVRGLAQGTLPEASFRYYLGQDYLFLAHFARAYGLAVYKSATLSEMRQAAKSMVAILDVEMTLHVDYCAGWGLDEDRMQALPEDPATMAYTRYVLETGIAGDLLDLHVALAPCIVGYGEIGSRLAADSETRRDGNPYADWIEMYASEDYQDVVAGQIELLDRLFEARGGAGRLPGLARTFREATRLETAFWQMGLDAAR